MTSASAAPVSGFLTTGQVADRIGATSQYVRELIHSGVLDAIDIGIGDRPRFRVSAESVARFLTDRVVTPAAKAVA
ncbi:helix-turn-helix domain-containing protein [Streptomyces sp. NPDC054887]